MKKVERTHKLTRSQIFIPKGQKITKSSMFKEITLRAEQKRKEDQERLDELAKLEAEHKPLEINMVYLKKEQGYDPHDDSGPHKVGIRNIEDIRA